MTQEFSKKLSEDGHEQTIHDVSVVSSQNVTFNQTQIIQISVEEVKTRKFIIASPYKGLKKFESEDKDRFFGRDQFLTRLVNELEQTNLVLLLGASGSGKSSVIRAGLIPWLAERQGSRLVSLVFTPDQDPFESLYASLLGKYKQSEAQIARIAKEDTLTQLVRSLKQPDAYWFILIDQFEELFTTTEANKRDVFIKSLVQLVKTLDKAGDRSVKLVATMRADFLDRLSPYPDLIKVTDKHRPMIAEMQLDELRLAIEQPAAHHGVVFETGLVKQIIDDVQGQAGYLPLLQYTLNLLWETEVQNQGIEDRTLNISNYRKLGGVRGALQQHVDQIYKSLSASEKLSAQRIFLKLVGIGEDEEAGTEWKPVRRRANRSEFSGSLEQTVLTQLVNQNLLVSNRVADSQESTIEIAHEALLTSWVTLNNWIKDNRQAIALRNRLNDDVGQWKKTKSHEDLWSGSRLEQALELRKDETFNQVLGGLSQEANQFLDASQGERDRLQKEKLRRTQIAAISAIVVACLLGALGLNINRLRQKAQAREDIATARNLLATNPTQAAVISIYATGESEAYYKELLSSSESISLSSIQRSREENLFEEHEGPVLAVAMNPDRQTIASAGFDGKVILTSISDSSLQETIENFDNSPATSVAFSHDGEFVASADSNGNVRVRRLQDNALLCDYVSHMDRLTELLGQNNDFRAVYGADPKTLISFNPQNDNFLVSAGPDNNIYQLDMTNGNCNKQSLVTLEAEEVKQNQVYKVYPPLATSVAFSPDGKLLAIGFGHESGLLLYNLSDGKKQLLWEGQSEESVESIAFEDEIFFGICIHEWAEGNSITIKTLNEYPYGDINFSEGFRLHEDCSRAILFDPKTDRIVSGGNDRGDGSNLVSFISWNVNNLFPFIGHQGTVNTLAMSQDKKHLASGGSDGTVRLWRMESFPYNVDSLFRNQSNNEFEIWDFVGRRIKLARQNEAIENKVESESLITTESKETPFASNQQYPKTFVGYDGKTVITVKDLSGSSSGTHSANSISGKQILIKDRVTGALLGKLKLDKAGDILFVAANHSQNKVIVIKEDIIEILDFRGTILDSLQNDQQSNVAAISPDGRIFATAREHFGVGSRNTPLHFFDIEGNIIGRIENEGLVEFLAFSSDSRYLMTGKFGEVYFFPANWQAYTEILCDRLRYHPALNDPQDEIARGARETCQKRSPDWQTR